MIDKNLAETSNPLELIASRASYSNQDIKVVKHIRISEDLELISQEPQEFLENGVIVNIITSNNKLMVQTLSNKYSFQ